MLGGRRGSGATAGTVASRGGRELFVLDESCALSISLPSGPRQALPGEGGVEGRGGGWVLVLGNEAQRRWGGGEDGNRNEPQSWISHEF